MLGRGVLADRIALGDAARLALPSRIDSRFVEPIGRRSRAQTIVRERHWGAEASFVGRTTRRPSCSTYDGYNVVGFKGLTGTTLARTCYWTLNGRIVEADIIINSNKTWALSLAGCVNRSVLEATMTHEVGHAFGLGHVSEVTHGRLTMSPVLDAVCGDNESTLGLGDVRGLEALY
jgi:Matrixin